MAKADATQVYRSGVQLVAVNNHLPQPTIVASPRSATQLIQFSPSAQEHAFFGEFYADDMKSGAPTSMSVFTETLAVPVAAAPKRSMWAEQRARLSLLSGVAKKFVFNFLRR
jgi:hypothetical protein